MPDEARSCQIQLEIEYNRLLAWAKEAGMIEFHEGGNIALSLGADHLNMLSIVGRIQKLLQDFSELNRRYEELKSPYRTKGEREDALKRVQTEDIVKQMSTLELSYEKSKAQREHLRGTNHIRQAWKNLIEITKHPKRVIWVSMDKDVFKALLDELHTLIDHLREPVGDYYQRKIHAATIQTYTEMVQMRSDLRELTKLNAAVMTFLDVSSSEMGLGRNSSGALFKSLVEMKLQSLPLSDQGRVQSFTETQLSKENIYIRSRTEIRRQWTRATIMKEGEPDCLAWVEWKDYTKDSMDEDPSGQSGNDYRIPDETLRRTVALVEMLKLPKPDNFCTPDCLGFFDDAKVTGFSRIGWVFKAPPLSTEETVPHSLFEMFETHPRPSLTERVALALKLSTCILYMHAANWLHKAVCSQNVLFFRTQGELGVENPILSGFDYSRPESYKTTSVPPPDPRWDLYRWNGIQQDDPKNSHGRKTYDIYSLGLLLLEIANWKPLHKILLLEHYPEISHNVSRDVRRRLLSKESQCLSDLQDIAGRRYYNATVRCIETHGNNGLEIQEDDDQTSWVIGMALQHAYTRYVLEELQGIQT